MNQEPFIESVESPVGQSGTAIEPPDLSQQRALRLLTESDAHLNAPDRIEQNLLAAFRTQHQQDAVTSIEPVKIGLLTASPVKASFLSASYWSEIWRDWHLSQGALVVALLLVMVSGVTLARYRNALFSPSVSIASFEQNVIDADLQKRTLPRPDEMLLQADSVAFNPDQQAISNSASAQNQIAATSQAARLATVTRKRLAPEQLEQILVESEIATDYFPLIDESLLPNPDSMQVVRVDMPRATMARFGLPIADDRADLPITADLKIGSDGITRAIRFIQNDPPPAMTVYADQPRFNQNYQKAIQKVR